MTRIPGDKVVSLHRADAASTLRADIRAHAKMAKTFVALHKGTKEVAARLETLAAADTPTENRLRHIRSLPPAMRARMAVRIARRKIKQIGNGAQSPDSVLKDELRYLKTTRRFTMAQLRKLEARILASRPAERQNAALLLRFVAKMSAAGRPIARADLADVLRHCAAVGAERLPEKTSSAHPANVNLAAPRGSAS